MSGLTNAYVENLCKKVLRNHKFYGVFPCNHHPSVEGRTYSLIFNTGDSSTPGEHFVAIYANNTCFYYFDSFGVACSDENINSFIKENLCGRKLIWNNTKIQHDSSNFCGFFCLGFLLSKDRGIKMYYRIFRKSNLMLNNEIVLKFILKHLS